MNNNKIDPKQEEKKKKFKKIGFCLVIPGLLCLIVAFVDFFTSIGGYGGPSLFFLFFIGIPLVFAGGVCLQFGYMGQISRYVASQHAPVAKDTTNYILDGTRDEVSKTVSSVADALKGNKKDSRVCGKCGTENDGDATFCDNCGNILIKTCKYCGTENDSDAKFCKGCGKEIC